MKDSEVVAEFEEIAKDYTSFVHAKYYFERQTATLPDMVRIVTILETELMASSTVPEVIKEKFLEVFTNNTG